MNIQLFLCTDNSEMLIGNPIHFFSAFSVAYRRECVAAAVQLLEKICKAVQPSQFRHRTHTEIPVACLNLVALVADLRDQNQVCVILPAG